MGHRIGVIVPAYNAEKSIDRCLNSIINQSINGHIDYRIFVVDDGSTDSTPAILADYAEKNPELIEVISQENQGEAGARNTGLQRALESCDFISFVDADDLITPIFLETLYTSIADKEAAIALCDYEAVSPSGQFLFRYYEGNRDDFFDSFLNNKRQLQFFGASLCNKMFSAEVIKDTVFPLGVKFPDLARTYGIGLKAKDIVKTDNSLYLYYQDQPGSISAAADDRFMGLIDAVNLMLDDFEQAAALDALRVQLTYVAVLHLLRGRMRDFLVKQGPDLTDPYLDAAFNLLDTRLPQWRSDLKKNRIIKSYVSFVMRFKALMKLYARFAHYTGY